MFLQIGNFTQFQYLENRINTDANLFSGNKQSFRFCSILLKPVFSCGPSNRKVHVIFTYNGKQHLIKKNIACKDDDLTHLYTLILNPDNTYEVQIDGTKAESGDLEADCKLFTK